MIKTLLQCDEPEKVFEEFVRNDLVVFLDSLDEIPGQPEPRRYSINDPLLGPRRSGITTGPALKMVITCRPEYLEEHKLSVRDVGGEGAELLYLEPFDRDDGRQYIRALSKTKAFASDSVE
eukprot:gene11299-3865_t